jgi:Rap1a immunity proteins
MYHCFRQYLFVFVYFLAFVSPTMAQDFTGVELYKICNGIYGRPDDGVICIAYIRGLSEGLILGQVINKSKLRTCLPEPLINPTQAELLVKKFLTDNPNRLRESAFVLVGEALLKAFPCRSSSAPK